MYNYVHKQTKKYDKGFNNYKNNNKKEIKTLDH